jgi:site-specific DNA recombinase
VLDKEFSRIIKGITLDKEVLAWIVTALKESHKDEKRYHEEEVSKLEAQRKKLMNRMEKLYVDKLDEVISASFYAEKKVEWQKEIDNLHAMIGRHQKANASYMDSGIALLELTQNGFRLYSKQSHEEKRQMLNSVISNSILVNGRLHPTYKQPFDLLAESKSTYLANLNGNSTEDSPQENGG